MPRHTFLFSPTNPASLWHKAVERGIKWREKGETGAQASVHSALSLLIFNSGGAQTVVRDEDPFPQHHPFTPRHFTFLWALCASEDRDARGGVKSTLPQLPVLAPQKNKTEKREGNMNFLRGIQSEKIG